MVREVHKRAQLHPADRSSIVRSVWWTHSNPLRIIIDWVYHLSPSTSSGLCECLSLSGRRNASPEFRSVWPRFSPATASILSFHSCMPELLMNFPGTIASVRTWREIPNSTSMNTLPSVSTSFHVSCLSHHLSSGLVKNIRNFVQPTHFSHSHFHEFYYRAQRLKKKE